MQTKFIHILIVLILMLLSIKGNASDSKYFYINLELEQITATIRVNDIPVFKDYVDHRTEVSIPINYALINKLNSIQIALADRVNGSEFTARAYFSYNLGSKNALDEYALESIDSFRFVAAKVSHDGLPTNYKLISQDDKVVVNRAFNVGNIFPQWEWLGGMSIENDSAAFDSLLNEYKKLYVNFKNKNEKLLIKKTSLKAKEYKQYYFLNSIEDAQNKTGYSDVMNSNNAKLVPFWEKGMELDVFANGKLARIADGDGDSPIVYLIGDGNTAYVVKVIYMKDIEGRWQIIR